MKTIPLWSKQKFQAAFLIPIFYVLVSCGQQIKTPIQTPIALPSTSPRIPTSTPTFFPVSTSFVHPSNIVQLDTIFPPYSLTSWDTIYEYNKQITDGNLMLYAEEIEPNCHEIKADPTNAMRVRLVFRNITKHPLFLVNDFDVARNSRLTAGDIVPAFYNNDGKQFHISSDAFDYHYNDNPESALLLQPGAELEIQIEILLPEQLWAAKGVIAPGQYLTKIIYHNEVNLMSDGKNLWAGLITSNLIEFCMQE